jgi:CRP-like cAMP-binding protein
MRPSPPSHPTSAEELQEALRSCEAIGEWPDACRFEFARLGRCIERRQGVLLHRRGTVHSGFYVLLQGAVEFSRVLPDGRHYVMPYIPAGQLFGVAALLGNCPHLFDVRTRVDSRLLHFDDEALRAFLLQRPAQLMSLAAILSSRYSRLFEQLEVMAMMPLRQRLARVLLELAAGFGQAKGGDVEITLRVAQEDLAAMAAGSRQRVNVEFGALTAEGILSVSYGSITVHDIERLRKEAGRTSNEPDN